MRLTLCITFFTWTSHMSLLGARNSRCEMEELVRLGGGSGLGEGHGPALLVPPPSVQPPANPVPSMLPDESCWYGGDCPFCHLSYLLVSARKTIWQFLRELGRRMRRPRIPATILMTKGPVTPCREDQLSIDIVSGSEQAYSIVSFFKADDDEALLPLDYEMTYPSGSPDAKGTLVCTNAFQWTRMELLSSSGDRQVIDVSDLPPRPGYTLTLHVL